MPTEQAFERPDGTFDTRRQFDLYCPHCGYMVADPTELLMGNEHRGIGCCSACEHEFWWTVEWEPWWTSTKPSEGQP